MESRFRSQPPRRRCRRSRQVFDEVGAAQRLLLLEVVQDVIEDAGAGGDVGVVRAPAADEIHHRDLDGILFGLGRGAQPCDITIDLILHFLRILPRREDGERTATSMLP
jgi:hypothetical protein